MCVNKRKVEYTSKYLMLIDFKKYFLNIDEEGVL